MYVTQFQARGAVQPAGGAAPVRHAVGAPGDGDLKRQIAGGRWLLLHQCIGWVQELGVRH